MPKKKLENPNTAIIPEVETGEVEVKRFKSRTLMLMLYPDNPEHCKAVNELREADLSYAIILHDKDTWSAEDELENPEHIAGELKKAHWHIVLRFSNPCWNTSVCTRFCIEERFCKKAESCDEALEYLVHKNHPDKYQYHVDDVSGDLSSRLVMLIGKDGKTEGEQVLEILEYLDSFVRSVTVTELVRWACESGHYGYLRQGGSLLMRVLDEHNTRFITGRTDYRVECAQSGFRAFVDGFEACRKEFAK